MLSKTWTKELLTLLSKKKSIENEIKITHQEIASELGTSREVVSRILKDFEHEQLINLSRGAIFIKNSEILRKKLK